MSDGDAPVFEREAGNSRERDATAGYEPLNKYAMTSIMA